MPFIKNTNTKVKLVNNTEINIEDLKAGDWILNKDAFPAHVRGHVLSTYKSHQKAIKINDELICTWDQIFIGADNFYYEFDKKVELKNVIKSDSLSSNDEIQEYVTTSGEAVKFKNEILVQCEKDKYCEDDFESLNLSNRTKLSEDFFFLTR